MPESESGEVEVVPKLIERTPPRLSQKSEIDSQDTDNEADAAYNMDFTSKVDFLTTLKFPAVRRKNSTASAADGTMNLGLFTPRT